MLEGELDGHLGYDKHEQAGGDNARNGYGKKKVKRSYGETEIRVPRDRDASFNPIIVPKWESMVEGLEEVIVSLYCQRHECFRYRRANKGRIQVRGFRSYYQQDYR